jgi:hypothetical protein
MYLRGRDGQARVDRFAAAVHAGGDMADSSDDSRDPGEITRRDFMRVSTLAAGAAAVGGCGSSPSGPADDPLNEEPPEVVDPTASVYAVTGTDLASMTRRGLDDMGGIGAVVHQG